MADDLLIGMNGSDESNLSAPKGAAPECHLRSRAEVLETFRQPQRRSCSLRARLRYPYQLTGGPKSA
jgi:hypothetical protein